MLLMGSTTTHLGFHEMEFHNYVNNPATSARLGLGHWRPSSVAEVRQKRCSSIHLAHGWVLRGAGGVPHRAGLTASRGVAEDEHGDEVCGGAATACAGTALRSTGEQGEGPGSILGALGARIRARFRRTRAIATTATRQTVTSSRPWWGIQLEDEREHGCRDKHAGAHGGSVGVVNGLGDGLAVANRRPYSGEQMWW
jgi:hypothetical protein